MNPLHRNHTSHIKMTRHPSIGGVTFDQLASYYGVTHFRECIARFIVNYNYPEALQAQWEWHAAVLPLQFCKVPVFHKAKFWEGDFPLYRHASDEYDVVHATPGRFDKRGHPIAGRFDTALVNEGTGGSIGVRGW